MNHTERQYCFVEFDVQDEPTLERLSKVTAEFQRQKEGDATAEDAHWLPYFESSDRTSFAWLSEEEMKRWNEFWFSTPLPHRHSPEMPTPQWSFGSMVDAILVGDYDIIGIRSTAPNRARLEFDPHGYPYGGTGSLRALIRAFGHKITGFDDGTGFNSGDPQQPRWTPDMKPPWGCEAR